MADVTISHFIGTGNSHTIADVTVIHFRFIVTKNAIVDVRRLAIDCHQQTHGVIVGIRKTCVSWDTIVLTSTRLAITVHNLIFGVV